MTSFPTHAAAKLWAEGHDTTEIAKRLKRKEAAVWARMDDIRRLAAEYLKRFAA